MQYFTTIVCLDILVAWEDERMGKHLILDI